MITPSKNMGYAGAVQVYLRPLFLARVQGGYPSLASDEIECWVDLNRHVFKNPEATITLWMEGDHFRSHGVFHDDLVIADCSLEPRDGQLVVAMMEGARAVRRLSRRSGREFLVTDDGPGASVEIGGGRNVQIIAVVTHTVHIIPG